jgi:hypothetical protein
MSGSTVGYSVGSGEDFLGTAEIILILIYGFMVFLASSRGKNTQKGYLFIFPLIAGIIDVFFPIIIFVPTIFNVAAMILGIPDGKKSEDTK